MACLGVRTLSVWMLCLGIQSAVLAEPEISLLGAVADAPPAIPPKPVPSPVARWEPVWVNPNAQYKTFDPLRDTPPFGNDLEVLSLDYGKPITDGEQRIRTYKSGVCMAMCEVSAIYHQALISGQRTLKAHQERFLCDAFGLGATFEEAKAWGLHLRDYAKTSKKAEVRLAEIIGSAHLRIKESPRVVERLKVSAEQRWAEWAAEVKKKGITAPQVFEFIQKELETYGTCNITFAWMAGSHRVLGYALQSGTIGSGLNIRKVQMVRFWDPNFVPGTKAELTSYPSSMLLYDPASKQLLLPGSYLRNYRHFQPREHLIPGLEVSGRSFSDDRLNSLLVQMGTRFHSVKGSRPFMSPEERGLWEGTQATWSEIMLGSWAPN